MARRKDYQENFRENVKIHCEKQGLQQQVYAQRANISPAAFCRILSGERVPKLDTAAKIAEAINVPLDELIKEQKHDK